LIFYIGLVEFLEGKEAIDGTDSSINSIDSTIDGELFIFFFIYVILITKD